MPLRSNVAPCFGCHGVALEYHSKFDPKSLRYELSELRETYRKVRASYPCVAEDAIDQVIAGPIDVSSLDEKLDTFIGQHASFDRLLAGAWLLATDMIAGSHQHGLELGRGDLYRDSRFVNLF